MSGRWVEELELRLALTPWQFDYCKHERNCRKMHVKCEKVSCEIDNCNLRYSKIWEWCKFHHKKVKSTFMNFHIACYIFLLL